MGVLHLPSHVVVDTPGQIEIFTWSASGAIITDAVASALPTVIAYIVDTPRAVAPATFMSNMLYACRYVVIAPPFVPWSWNMSVCIAGVHWEFPSPRKDLCSLELQHLNCGCSSPVSGMTHFYSPAFSTRPSFRS